MKKCSEWSISKIFQPLFDDPGERFSLLLSLSLLKEQIAPNRFKTKQTRDIQEGKVILERLESFVQLLDNLLQQSPNKSLHLDGQSDIIVFITTTLLELLQVGFAPYTTKTFSEILSWDAYNYGTPPIFTFLERHLNNARLRFVFQQGKTETSLDKGFEWLLLELYSKSLFESFSAIIATNEINKHYNTWAPLKKYWENISTALQQLDKMSISISNEGIQSYWEFQHKLIQGPSGFQAERIQRTTALTPIETGSIIKNKDSTWSNKQPNLESDLQEQYSPNFDYPDVLSQQHQRDFSIHEIHNNILQLQGQFSTEDVDHDAKMEVIGVKSEEIKGGTRAIEKAILPLSTENNKQLQRKSSAETLYGGKSDSSDSNDNIEALNRKTLANSQNKKEQPIIQREQNRSMDHKVKRSTLLYKQKFKKDIDMYKYRERINIPASPKLQANKCYGCGERLPRFLWSYSKANGYCNYTGNWYCSNCYGEQKSEIPWRVIERLDCELHSVSKQGKEEIDKARRKCNLIINPTDDIVNNHLVLYKALLKKRELHLIFDSICNEELVLDLIPKRLNLVLRENLLSLQNLVEIQSGSLMQLLEQTVSILSKHFHECHKCQKKGLKCGICKSEQKIFLFDVTNTSFCHKCREFFHTSCLEVRGCTNCSPKQYYSRTSSQKS